MKNKNQNSKEFKCAYPDCDNCDETFEVPNCMLADAGININESVVVIPYEGCILIRQDEGDT